MAYDTGAGIAGILIKIRRIDGSGTASYFSDSANVEVSVTSAAACPSPPTC